MRLGKLLGGGKGWRGAVNSLLLLGLGGFILFISAADLREAARFHPVPRDCADWLADPTGPRWVALTGCRLDLREAASRRWKGWASTRDGGIVGEHYLELFIPLFAGPSVEELQPAPRAVLATSDQALLSLMDGIDRLTPEELPDYLEANEAAFEVLLAPEVLTGYVEPVKSMAARSALGVLTAERAVVLEHGREPPRANAIFGLVVGLGLVAVAMRTLFRRSRAQA